MIKILVVGDFHANLHEQAFYDAFSELGYDTEKFSWHQYFGKAPYNRSASKLLRSINLWSKVQYHFSFGPLVNKLNRELLKKVREYKPDLVFIYRGTHIKPKTLNKIKSVGAVIFGYNNDDPFSKKYPAHFWRHFRKGIKYYDHLFAYRHKNIADYQAIGYAEVSLLRSYYIKKNNFHYDILPSHRYDCDVMFAGHFENDGRDEYLKVLLEKGINLRLFGSDWHQSKHFQYFIDKCGPIDYLNNQEFNLALNSTKIALVFFSKLNNDTYTRRVFEIVAAKTLMLAPYTDDMASMFAKGKEADYFNSPVELLAKVKYYLDNALVREQLVESAFLRLANDGHEVKDRVKEVVKVYQEVHEKNLNH